MRLINKSPLISVFSQLILLCALTPNALASPAGAPSSSCSNSTDAHEVATKISSDSKKFAGQCIDSQRFRPAVLIKEESSSITYANYFHEDQYWDATVSKSAEVEAIYVQVVRFNIVSGVTAAHVQMRAKMAKGSEIDLARGDKKQKATDLILSFEAARPKDVPYNFALGVVNNYLLVGRINSGAQRLSETDDETAIEQYEIDLSSEDRTALLLASLKSSYEKGSQFFYNTLKPNCTTEVFDLIDALPSQKKKNHEPFLTVLSNDPVAGPTIQGLKDRKIFKSQYANLKEEYAGETSAPSGKQKEAKQSFLPRIKNYPYSIVFASPSNFNNDKILAQAQKSLYGLAPKLVQAIGSSLMLAGDSSSALLSTLKDLSPLLKQELQSLEESLGGKTFPVALYLTPWDPNAGDKVDVMKELKVQARLPFKSYQTHFDPNSMNEIFSGLNDASQAHTKNKTPFGLTGIALQLFLKKGESNISLQVAGHAGEFKKKLDVKNDQVHIHTFSIPEPSASHLQPTAIIQLSQNVNDPQAKLHVAFGVLGGVEQDTESAKMGQLKISNDDGCALRANAVPTLEGNAAAIGLVDAWLQIFSVDFDLEKQIVSNIEVRTTTGIKGLKTGLFKACERSEKVNSQFTDNANTQIKTQKQKLKKSPGLSLLSEILSNNKTDQISGFSK